MKVMTKNTVSTTDLLKSVFKEEGVDLASFQNRKKPQKQKKWKQVMSFLKTIPGLVADTLELWSEKTSPASVGVYVVIWLGSLLLGLLLGGFYLILPASGWKIDPIFIIESSLILSITSTIPVLIHALFIHRAETKCEKEKLNNNVDGVHVIFSSLNSYIEEKRKDVIHRISQEKSELEEEISLLDAEISNLKNLIEEDNASGKLKQRLTESKTDLEKQVNKAYNEIKKLGKFRTKINESINFLIKNQSPKVSWGLRSVEALQRSSNRIQQSEKKIEESRLMVEDTIRDFARFWGLVTGKLEQVNNISGTKLTNSKEVMNLTDFGKFLPEEEAA